MVFITPDSFMEKSRNEKSAGVQIESLNFLMMAYFPLILLREKWYPLKAICNSFFPLEKKKLHHSHQVGMLKILFRIQVKQYTDMFKVH